MPPVSFLRTNKHYRNITTKDPVGYGPPDPHQTLIKTRVEAANAGYPRMVGVTPLMCLTGSPTAIQPASSFKQQGNMPSCFSPINPFKNIQQSLQVQRICSSGQCTALWEIGRWDSTYKCRVATIINRASLFILLRKSAIALNLCNILLFW